MGNCKAIRNNDEMQCGRCGLTWGISDKDVPKCDPIGAMKVNRYNVKNGRSTKND